MTQYVFVPGLSGQVEGYLLPTDESDNRAAVDRWVYHSGGRITAAPGHLDGYGQLGDGPRPDVCRFVGWTADDVSSPDGRPDLWSCDLSAARIAS